MVRNRELFEIKFKFPMARDLWLKTLFPGLKMTDRENIYICNNLIISVHGLRVVVKETEGVGTI